MTSAEGEAYAHNRFPASRSHGQDTGAPALGADVRIRRLQRPRGAHPYGDSAAHHHAPAYRTAPAVALSSTDADTDRRTDRHAHAGAYSHTLDGLSP